MSDHRGIVPDLAHEQYLAANGLSHSMLKIMREQSPMHLRAAMDAPPEPETEVQRIGALTHRAILIPETLKDAFHVKPQGMNFTTKDGKAWRDEHSDRPIVKFDEWETVKRMVDAVHRHPSARRLLKNAQFEQSIFVEDTKGTLRKLRPDVLPAAGNILPDLKTCTSAHPDDFMKSVADFGYWTQGAWYLDGTSLAGMEFDTFVLIAVEKTYPHAVATYAVDMFAIEYGRRINEALVERYRQCVETGVWPGYEEKISYIGLPPWLQKQAEQVA